MKHAVVTLLLGLVSITAGAQPVYRCGNVYSQTPCPQGRIVDATDARTDAQRADAQRVAAYEQQLAADMRRERLVDQLATRPAAPGNLSGETGARPLVVVEHARVKKKRVLVRPARSTDFIAVGQRPNR